MNRSDRAVGVALPRRLDTGGDAALLLVHGFASYPGVMDYLASRVHEAGFAVSVPRLPGHGTSAADYLSARGTDWLRRVVDSYQDLKARYERVYVCGLSLGGILTVLLAGEFEPSGIILLAPAILNTDRTIIFTPFVRRFIRSMRGRYEAQGQDLTNPEIAYLAEEYWSRRWPGPAAELLALQRRSRRVLPKVTAPCLVVVSKGDRTVPAAVAGYIERRISSEVETIILETSRHVLVTDSEKERVANVVVERIVRWDTHRAEGGARSGEARPTPAEAPAGSPRRA